MLRASDLNTTTYFNFETRKNQKMRREKKLDFFKKLQWLFRVFFENNKNKNRWPHKKKSLLRENNSCARRFFGDF